MLLKIFCFILITLPNANALDTSSIDSIKLSEANKSSDQMLIDDTEKRLPILLDVRSTEEVKSNPIKAAIHIPIEELNEKIYKFKSDISPTREIHVFCESGGRAEAAKKILEKNGYKKVLNRKSWRNI